jgi:hypothetical protein
VKFAKFAEIFADRPYDYLRLKVLFEAFLPPLPPPKTPKPQKSFFFNDNAQPIILSKAEMKNIIEKYK